VKRYPLDPELRKKPQTHWRARLHELIFEADTPSGKAFDILLIVSILLSVVAVMLESVAPIRERYHSMLYGAEWVFTIGFTIEYILRLICIGRPVKYATSFFGVIDLLAVIPTYLDLLFPGTHFLFVIRILRLLRIFRVLKLVQFVGEANVLLHSLRASSRKITVFLFAVLMIAVIMGSLMYVMEGEEHGFTSIPTSIYWSIVTLTTVGYGDLSPATGAGKTVAAILMILGYSIIAVPTGIVASQYSMIRRQPVTTQNCPQCSAEGHDADADYCKHCGANLSGTPGEA
jgi:voltage-gated potassium channel